MTDAARMAARRVARTVRNSVNAAPEAGLTLPMTQAVVVKSLEGLSGFEIETGNDASWIVARTPGCGAYDQRSAHLLIRADMDALPIGPAGTAVHACGHDVHTAVLAGVAVAAAEMRDRPPMVLVFQPGEEGFGGADITLHQSEILNSTDIACAIALHVDPNSHVGTVMTRGGHLMAGFVEVEVEFVGAGGHSGFPERAINPMTPMVLFMQALSYISTEVGTTAGLIVNAVPQSQHLKVNVIPDHANVRVSLRTCDQNALDTARGAVTRIANGIADAFRCTVTTTDVVTYRPLVNDESAYERVRTAIPHVQQIGTPLQAAEDFSSFVHRFGGFMVLLGAAELTEDEPSVLPGCHSPAAVFSDDAIDAGIDTLLSLAVCLQ